MKRLFTILLGALLLYSCNSGDIDLGGSREIAFNTKHIQRALTQADIDGGGKAKVFVCGMQNNTTVLYSHTEITRDASTGKWFPATTKFWAENSSYTFHGYAYNLINGEKPTNLEFVIKTSGTNKFDQYGLEVNITQPSSYDESQMIDYLVSYNHRVANGASKPIVQIHLEHVMTLAEFYVVRGNLFDARLKEMTFSNIYNQANLRCTSQAVLNSGEKNIWSVTLSGQNDVVYTYRPSTPIAIGSTRDETAAKMAVLCIPQQLTAATKFTIIYEVNEKVTEDSDDNWVEHTETFSLYNYNPMNYQSGHRVVYTATVDSGVNLEGVVKDWIDVDYIEGTVLPEID